MCFQFPTCAVTVREMAQVAADAGVKTLNVIISSSGAAAPLFRVSSIFWRRSNDKLIAGGD